MQFGFDHPEYLPWLSGAALLILAWYTWRVTGSYRRFFHNLGDFRFLRSQNQAHGVFRLIVRGVLVSLIFFLLGAVLVGVYRVRVVPKPQYQGMEIVFVLDGSLSMLAKDVAPSRFVRSLKEIKNVAGALEGKGDKIGLVIFAEIGIPYVPYLTSDNSMFKWYLDTLDESLLENDLPKGSNISDGLFEGLKLFSNDEKKKVIVLVSDGEPADVADPERKYLEQKFAEAAKRYGELKNVSVFLIGIGDPSKKSLIPIRNSSGQYYRYSDGPRKDEFLLTSPNLWFLQDMAKMFGGTFKHSRTGYDLKDLMSGVIESRRPITSWLKKEERENLGKYLLMAALVCLFLFPILKSP